MASGRSATSSHSALMPRRLKATEKGPATGMRTSASGNSRLRPLPDGEDHRDAAIALGVEWFQRHPVLQGCQQGLVDGRDGVAFDQLHLGAVGLGFEVVDVNAHGNRLMPVFEIRAPMGLEKELGIPGDFRWGAPDKASGRGST